MVPKSKPPAGAGGIKSHVLEVGRPDAQRVSGKTPCRRLSQQRGKWLNEPGGAGDFSETRECHDRCRRGNPVRNNGEKRGGHYQMKRAGGPVKKCEYQPPQPLARKAPCTLQA